MAYENEKAASSTQGTAAVTLSAITTGLLALGGANGGNGILSGLLGGGNQQQLSSLMMENSVLKAQVDVDQKLVSVYTELRRQDKEQDAKISSLDARVLALETAGPLKEQLFDQKIARVTDTMTCCCNATNAALASLQATVNSFSSVYVNASSVTPLPMQRYNSFTVPTTPTTATAAQAGA